MFKKSKKSEEKKDEKGGEKEEEEEKKAEPEDDPEQRKVKLKAGDYMIQVHIIEGRDFKGRESTGMSDPVCVIECMGKKQQTKIHKQSLNPMFDQVFYFEFKKLEPGEVEAGIITINVFDANTIRRNELIGMYQFDCAGIYYRKHHELFRTWCALTDVTDNNEGIQGYLKVSIIVLGPDDEQHIHTAAEMDDESDDMMAVLMPPAIEQKGKLLKIRVHDMIDLPNMDKGSLFGGGCDPYAQVEFGGVKVKSTRKKGMSVTLNEELQVPVMEPVMAGVVKLSAYDWDSAGSDDRIKTVNFQYNSIKKNGFPLQWVNFYGAPLGKQRGLAGKMNKDYIEGSWFRGRALVEMELIDEEEPKKNSCGCMPATRPPEAMYRLQFDLYEGSEIPDKGDMHVEISIGNEYFISTSKPVEEGRCLWYEELKDAAGDDITVQFPEDLDQVPQVYVYLVHKSKRISFTTYNFRELVERGWKIPPEWVILREDVSLDALDDTKAEFPGMLLFSLRVGLQSDVPANPYPESRPLSHDLQAPSKSRVRKPSQPVSKVGTLKVEVVEGHDLPIMDRHSSDPYVKLGIDKQQFKTKVIVEDCNPKWSETFTFTNVPIDSVLEVTCKDHDKIGKDDTMGYFEVDLRSQQTDSGRPFGSDFVTDNWFLIADKHPNARVRLTFTFKYLPLAQSRAVEDHIAKKAEKDRSRRSLHNLVHGKETAKSSTFGSPENAQYQLRAHIYQARGLPAVDSSGLADPYATIRCCGKKLKTSIIKETVNPQWYESHAIIVDLPTPLTLAPHIQVFIFDHDTIGKDDPMGRFDVPVTEAFNMNPSVDELEPRWFTLYDWENNELPGAKVLASFQILDGRLASAPMPNIRPDTVPYFLEITTLGLRDLTSTLGVHKTYAEFELPNQKRFKTEKSSKPTSKSPNFLQILTIPIDLPVRKLFAPYVDLEVKDTLFGGLIKRVIATAAIDLGEFMVEDEKGFWQPAKPIEVLDEADLEAEVAEEERKEAAAAKEAAYKKAREEEEAKEKQAEEEEMESDEEHGQPLINAPHSESIEMAPLDFGDSDDSTSEEEDDGLGLGSLPDLNVRHHEDAEHHEDKPLIEADQEQKLLDSKEEEKEVEDPRLKKKPEEPKEDFDDGTVEDKGFSADVLKEMDDDDPNAEPKPEYMKGRPVVDNELEDVVTMQPFITIPLWTGQKNAGLFGKELRQVGRWKGLIRLCEDKNEPSPINTNELLRPEDLFIRLYILRGHALVPMDSDGTSDPYLIIKCGNEKISTRDRKIKNELNPEFFERFEIPCQIPGTSTIEIKVMDWDGIGDDLIGTTTIDIEDRWFSKKWRKMKRKPVEFRTLHSPTSLASQGKLELWIDIVTPLDAKKIPMWDIKPPPPDPYEMRVIIWGTRDVTIKDLTTEQNDLYVTCAPSTPGLKKQETDTHFRSKKGLGNFNWRMKWPIMLPPKKRMWPRLRFQIWDKDFFSRNDSICESIISLKGLCVQAMKNKDRTKILIKGKERFWLEDLRHPNEEGSQGRMEISVELMPEPIATQIPAGFGRGDPNQNPHLPPPEGRFKWSLNPFSLMRQLLGDRLYRKCCLAICCFLFMSAVGFMAPMILSGIAQKGVLKALGME